MLETRAERAMCLGILLVGLVIGGFTGPLDEVLIHQIPPPLGVARFHELATDLPLVVLHRYILPRHPSGGQDRHGEQHR